ncbi:ABC transporter permease [Pseudomonas sp. 8Z]|uniref:MlaD family protein n=1 Tax=Pseudomonas sp. 8Z TaxID=2653166 RepID=UPI0012F25FF6|nr:MlaD family protein [Pseudomonas sp. 8Z]VXC07126.1 ABC transporter permease [Pseudomonas sp. 8Z]
MEPRAHHVLIGLFTVVTVGAALLFALWLGKIGADKAFTDYEVVFHEDVTGLSQGSAVQYSGINIGDVITLGLDPKDPSIVRARIRVSGASPIKSDTRARLAITSITGLAVIQLYSGTPQSPPLEGQDGRPGVIIADPSPLSRLMSNGEDLVVGITRLLEQANRLLSDDNTAHISRTLANLEQATAGLAEQRQELSTALQQVAAATHEAGELLRSANRLIEGSGKQTLENTERLSASLERSSRMLETLLDSNHQALDNGMQSLGQLGPAIGELRDTLGALRSFSQRLERDPAGYLLRNDSVKEFQP